MAIPNRLEARAAAEAAQQSTTELESLKSNIETRMRSAIRDGEMSVRIPLAPDYQTENTVRNMALNRIVVRLQNLNHTVTPWLEQVDNSAQWKGIVIDWS